MMAVELSLADIYNQKTILQSTHRVGPTVKVVRSPCSWSAADQPASPLSRLQRREGTESRWQSSNWPGQPEDETSAFAHHGRCARCVEGPLWVDLSTAPHLGPTSGIGAIRPSRNR